MDFIVKFLQSEDISTEIKYNNILIIINKLIKYIYFILYKKLFENRLDYFRQNYLISQNIRKNYIG